MIIKKMKKPMYKKDILFLCQYFYPEYISSATLPYDTAMGFVKAGHKVDVICGYPKEYNQSGPVACDEIVNGIQIHRVKYLSVDRSNIIFRLLNFITFLMGILLQLPRMKQYKVIFVYSNPPVLPIIAVLSKKLFKNKIVFVSYDVYPDLAIKIGKLKDSGLPSKLIRILNRIMFRNIDWIIALSNDMKKHLVKKSGFSHRKITVIPNWYADEGRLDHKMRSDTNLFRDFKEDDFIVSYLGNMGTAQDIHTIVKAMELAKNDKHIKFIFAGHGNKLKDLMNTVKKNKYHNVHIFDYLQGDDFKDVLSISNCFVVSLEKGLYGLCSPSKASSYMMQGRPILCVMDKNMDLAKDIVENEIGYCIANGDSKTFYQSILYLMENEHDYNKMSMRCREIFLSKYEKEVCIDKYVRFVDRCLK